MIEITKYSPEYKHDWNEFAIRCKNFHFMFLREYMEYHADRFLDCSFIIKNDKGETLALLPANRVNNVVYSHQGLTFGGLLFNHSMRASLMIDIFDALLNFLKEMNISSLVYKCIPHIYHQQPAEEDLYALFRVNAHLFRRDVSVAIDLSRPLKFSSLRSRSIKKAAKQGVQIIKPEDQNELWPLLESVLKANHSATPTHTKNEISALISCFPENIKPYLAIYNNTPISGAITYETNDVVHAQYLMSNDIGRKLGGLDLIIDHIIGVKCEGKRYFDLGISNENNGWLLNEGLIAQKEGFGARSIVHDFYKIEIK